ncbi:hypothetical protein [Sigmofec virus UA08Rod_3874]|uniref:Uncharacterized protein n=1 Tax=Sigmofec virus UA08Rod_3874 TaxID=2929391 RepID=A0A976R8N9_9VIRU|nr:hypothetical protein [Sigmofec virus UA08Rod_3874]
MKAEKVNIIRTVITTLFDIIVNLITVFNKKHNESESGENKDNNNNDN